MAQMPRSCRYALSVLFDQQEMATHAKLHQQLLPGHAQWNLTVWLKLQLTGLETPRTACPKLGSFRGAVETSKLSRV